VADALTELAGTLPLWPLRDLLDPLNEAPVSNWHIPA
jgi:hypothetical protein